MICFPNAKINLGLSVTEKRPDGFHNIETILYPVDLKDILEIIIAPDKKFSFTASGLQIPGESKNNLVIKAIELLRKDFQLDPVEIHLHKAIPMGAGLGGGSSDAACTVKLLNDLFELDLSVSEMQEYARQLGSDCAFFIENKPAFAYQRGDETELIELKLDQYKIVIVKPDCHIPTNEAYSWAQPGDKGIPVKKIMREPAEKWRAFLFNAFEPEVIKRFPEIGEIKNALYRNGAFYASMSGSGSAVFGIFASDPILPPSFDKYFIWRSRK